MQTQWVNSGSSPNPSRTSLHHQGLFVSFVVAACFQASLPRVATIVGGLSSVNIHRWLSIYPTPVVISEKGYLKVLVGSGKNDLTGSAKLSSRTPTPYKNSVSFSANLLDIAKSPYYIHLNKFI